MCTDDGLPVLRKHSLAVSVTEVQAANHVIHTQMFSAAAHAFIDASKKVHELWGKAIS